MNNNIKELMLHLIPEVKVYYGIDIASEFPGIINDYKFDKIFFVTEHELFNLHGKNLYNCLVAQNLNCELIMIDANEKAKNMGALDDLCSELISKRISKDSIVVSFGGGIVGNVAGLAAALIYRGVKYVEIPTTFMGQTDSSLSNKQAVNGRTGKNQLGVYSAPIFIWSDLKYIETESTRHIKAGIVEGIKNGLISNKYFLDVLMPRVANKTKFSLPEIYELFELITESKNDKILYVDPTEKKFSVVLEYGHTFGHAIEFLSSGRVIHGEAVAMGMCIAAEVSNTLGYLTTEEVNKHYDLLGDFMYNLKAIENIELPDAEKIYTAIQNDNKRTEEGVKYVVLSTLGTCLEGPGDYQIVVDKEVIISSINTFYRKYFSLQNVDGRNAS